MTVIELIDRLLQFDDDLPIVYRGPDHATGIPVEIVEAKEQAWIPDGALVARGDVCMIVASDGKDA